MAKSLSKKSINNMIAREVMTSPVTQVMTETPLAEIANLLLRERISAAPVLTEGGLLAGIVSEGDLVRRRPIEGDDRRSWWLDLFDADTTHRDEFLRYLNARGLRAKDVMTRDVVSVNEDTPIARIAELLETHRIKRVPVLRDGRIVGIVSRANLLQALVQGTRVPGRARGNDRRR
jgi:CBS domain-containing protein